MENLSNENVSSEALRRNIDTIVEIENKALDKRSPTDRLSDKITAFTGSFVAFVLHTVAIIVWVIANLGIIPGIKPWDPFPFGLLTMFVSMEGVLLMIFVLITQNRQGRQADRRAHVDLQVSLLAEQEMTVALKLLRQLCHKHGIPVDANDQQVEQLSQETNVAGMVQQLEEKLPE